jgi:hypothetical protein
MQQEINAESTARPVHILGLNAVGYESGNADICRGRSIPWLQDTAQQNVWGRWNVTWRDVIVLDPDNSVIHIYNLTQHSLSDSANYANLKNILLQAAR